MFIADRKSDFVCFFIEHLDVVKNVIILPVCDAVYNLEIPKEQGNFSF